MNKLMLVVALLVVPAGAYADERGFYLGGGWSSVDASYAPSRLVVQPAAGIPEGFFATRELEPLGSNAWRLLAGYRAVEWLAVEGYFTRFSGNSRPTRLACVTTPCPARESGEADTTSLSALALYPRGPFDLFVKAGLTRWRAELGTFNSDGSRYARSRDDGTSLGYGAGVQLRGTHLAARLEYEHVDFGDDEAALVTLGAAWTF